MNAARQTGPPAGYRIIRTEPTLGRSRLQPYRLAELANYTCSRRGIVMHSRRLTVSDGDRMQLVCLPCTTVLAPAYEQASKR